mmetsp:Transcript_38062/g.89112  ORF Transcript_38062/g.89112 Transcript_38062/m.89112 type:complete len:208 (-) Transcript_38062:660-1283(-)
MQRVALCLAGQLRSLLDPGAVDRWEQTVLQPLEWPSLFIRVSVEGPESKRLSAANLAALWQRLRPIKYRVSSDEHELAAVNLSRQAAMRIGLTGKLLYQGFQGTLALRWAACLHDIEAFEASCGGRRFEWVVRMRPDLAFGCWLPPLRDWPSPTLAVLTNVDYLVVAPRALAAAVLQLGARQVGACSDVSEHECFFMLVIGQLIISA